MASASRKSTGRRTVKKVLTSVKKHPVRTAAIAAGTVVGVSLLRKAVNTAAKVALVGAVASGATKVAGAVGKGSRKGARRAKPRAKK